MARNLKKKKRIPKTRKVSKKGEGTSKTTQQDAKVWQPGVDRLEEGEELQCDTSAYDCLHAFHIGWPCLSFDIIHDSLGLVRTEFPHTVYCIAGTQADNAADNAIGVVKLSNISGKKRKLLPAVSDDEEDDSDNSSDDDDEDDDLGFEIKKPTLQIWDFNTHLSSLATSDPRVSTALSAAIHQAPLQIFGGHKDEGYAIDWSPVTPARLLSGDCKGCIHLWEPTSGGKWTVDKSPFKGHTDSVEDLQWSPTEANVFASCSVDRKIAIWDARIREQPALSIKAHDADVNVISWNRLASCMISSGSDDGSFSIWDLRSFKEDSLVAHFKYHKQPITSIEWSPHEASTLAVSSADNQLTIWDLSLERDEEEEAEFKAALEEKVNAPEDLPPQLLFVHQGQKDLKEVHWHAQIPGLLMSTSSDGFNVFKPTNIENVLPQQ